MVFTLVYGFSLEEVSALHIGCPVKITLPATSDWVTSGTVDHLLDRECTAQSLVGVRTPPFSSFNPVQAVEVFGGCAINVEPPVADKVLLLEQSSFGAGERLLGEATFKKRLDKIRYLLFEAIVKIR